MSPTKVVPDQPPKKAAAKRMSAGPKHPRVKKRSEKRATLTPRESTEITGFGLAHTYDLLRNGSMPSIKVGKQFYIPLTALLEWLRTCGQPPARTA